jgi:hypothetical protein
LLFPAHQALLGEVEHVSRRSADICGTPIQTDSVSYVSGRRDVLFTLFYLAAFHAYLSYRTKESRTWFVLFLCFWG